LDMGGAPRPHFLLWREGSIEGLMADAIPLQSRSTIFCIAFVWQQIFVCQVWMPVCMQVCMQFCIAAMLYRVCSLLLGSYGHDATLSHDPLVRSTLDLTAWPASWPGSLPCQQGELSGRLRAGKVWGGERARGWK
jgi:hypothetical protein